MKRKPKAIPPGPPLNTPDEELDMLALVAPEDIADAQAAGRQLMTDRGAALLDAEKAKVDEEET